MDWASFWIGVGAAYVIPAVGYGLLVVTPWALSRPKETGGACYVCDKLGPVEDHWGTNLTRFIAEVIHRYVWYYLPAHRRAWAEHPRNPANWPK